MSRFTFKKSTAKPSTAPTIEEGVHAAAIVQVAGIGLQRPFDKDDEPEAQLAVAFELAKGDLVARRMKFSDHPNSGCYATFTAAFPDLEEAGDDELDLAALLGKSVLIEVEVRDGKWPRVTEIMPLEDGFDPVSPQSELLEFDADEMDREVYLKLHRDIRSWISKRIRRP